jgi:hypothetical protein
MKQAFIYSLKVWLTGIIGTPVFFVLALYVLALLPYYHVPELIGFIVIVLVMPITLYLSVCVGVFLFLGLSLRNRFPNNNHNIKLILSGLLVIVCGIGIAILCLSSESKFDEYSCLSAAAFSITSLAAIWFYKLQPFDASPIKQPNE